MYSAKIADLSAQCPCTPEVTTSLEEGQDEIQMIIDRDKAGLCSQRCPDRYCCQNGRGRPGCHPLPDGQRGDRCVRLSEAGGTELSKVENMLVASFGTDGALGEIAEIREVQAPSTIQPVIRSGQFPSVRN